MLNLDALASWEAVVLASIRGATGSPDERDAQITRSGMYAEYPAIFASYVDLVAMGGDPAVKLEALKRAVFLAWQSFVALPTESGLAELPESSVRMLMRELDTTIASGRADDELRAMLAWYRASFGYVFEHFGPVRALEPFVHDLSAEEARRQLIGHRPTGDRGQLGRYWCSVANGSGAV